MDRNWPATDIDVLLDPDGDVYELALPTVVGQPKFGLFLIVVVDKVADSTEAPGSFRKMVAAFEGRAEALYGSSNSSAISAACRSSPDSAGTTSAGACR